MVMFNWYKCDDTISTDSTCSKCARELDERNNNNKRLIDSFFSRIKALRSFLFDENDEGKDTAQHIFGYSNKKFIFSLILTIITSLFCLYFFLPTDLNELILRSFSIPSTNDVISSKILRTGTIVVCDENVLAQTTCFRDVSYEIEWTKRNSYGSRWRMATIRKATPKCSVIDNVEIEITNYLEKIYTYLFFPKVILTQMVVKTSSNHLKSLMETNGENKRLIQTKSYCRTESGNVHPCCKYLEGCSVKIFPWKKRYNIENYSPMDMNSCACDGQFYQCLKNRLTIKGWYFQTSNSFQIQQRNALRIGQIYFNVIQPKCVQFHVGKRCEISFIFFCLKESNENSCLTSAENNPLF